MYGAISALRINYDYSISATFSKNKIKMSKILARKQLSFAGSRKLSVSQLFSHRNKHIPPEENHRC